MLTVVHNETKGDRSIIAFVSQQSIVYYEVSSAEVPLGLTLGSQVDINTSPLHIDNSKIDKRVKMINGHTDKCSMDLPRAVEVMYEDVLVGTGYFNYVEPFNLCYIDFYDNYRKLYRAELDYTYDARLDIIFLS